MKTRSLTAAAVLFSLALACCSVEAHAQSAGSWVDIVGGNAGSGANASGMFQIAKTKSSSKNGVGFGHGFALGAGPNGLALSNTVGVGGAPGGAAHNVQLNIGRNGAHLSHGGVVTQGGNSRVISGGHTGSQNGQVYGGSYSTGYGNHTKAYSKSHTHQFRQPTYTNGSYLNNSSYSTPNVTPAPSNYSTGNQGFSTSSPRRVIRGSGFRMFGR